MLETDALHMFRWYKLKGQKPDTAAFSPPAAKTHLVSLLSLLE